MPDKVADNNIKEYSSQQKDYMRLENMILDGSQQKRMSDFQLQNLMTPNVHFIFDCMNDSWDFEYMLSFGFSIVESFSDFVDKYNKATDACDLSNTISIISEEILTLMSWYSVNQTMYKEQHAFDNDDVFIELNKAVATGFTFDDCEVMWCAEYGFSPNSQIIKVYRECILNMNMDINVQNIENYYYCALACLVIMASNVDKLISGIKSGFTIKSTFWSDILLYDKEHV